MIKYSVILTSSQQNHVVREDKTVFICCISSGLRADQTNHYEIIHDLGLLTIKLKLRKFHRSDYSSA